ncbi:MAG: cell division protein FtsA [Bacilli bacterium]|nr:cell division protein FtsA [Bacilli bacterium]
MRKIIASLDIGNSRMKLVVGEIFRNKLNILACVETPSRGIKKGYVINPESATEALSEVFLKAEETIGIRPNKVIVNVPSNGVECFLSEGYTTINNEEQQITNNDIMKAIQMCAYNKFEENKEVVTILPTKYIINDVDVIDKPPIGMIADRLNVKAVVITVPKKNISTIARCLERIGVEIVDIAIGALGDYYQFKNKNTDMTTGAIVNIGASKTEVSIFNKGTMTSCEVIDIGGDNVDYDISYVYKVSRRDSLYLKENIALADKNKAQPSESIIFEDKHGGKVKINQFDASEVVMSRLQEILNLVKKQINLLTKKQISYIIITGGTTETAEFKTLVEQIFTNAIIGNVIEIGARNNKYSTSVGLVKYYDSRLKLRNQEFSIYNIDEQEEISGIQKKVNISEDSILGKLFGYFFDN